MLRWALTLLVAAAIGVALIGGWAGVALGAAATVGLFAGSLFLKEWQACPRCKGNPRRGGVIATGAHSFCGRCQGSSGSVVRMGVRVFRPHRAAELTTGAGRSNRWRG